MKVIPSIDADDYELAEAALAATGIDPRRHYPSHGVDAIRILHDECGWTLGKAKQVLDLIWASHGWPYFVKQ